MLDQESGWCVKQKYIPNSNVEIKENIERPIWEDDSQAVDLDAFDDSLFCNEILDNYDPVADSRLNNVPQYGSNVNADCAPGTSRGANSRFDDLENLDMGTPPDFNLAVSLLSFLCNNLAICSRNIDVYCLQVN